jgi:hypothetical protein
LVEIDGRELYRLDVPGAQAIARWRQLRALHGETGYWPVLLGPPEGLEGWRGSLAGLAGERAPSESIRLGEAMPFDEESVAEDLERLDLQGGRPSIGPAPGAPPPGNDSPAPVVLAGLVPAEKPWHVPAWLGWGGGPGGCPPPARHVAAMKAWRERHGAEVVAMDSGGRVQMRVENPPRTAKAALRLAREHRAYCAGSAGRGGPGWEESLARSLLGQRAWSFCWA